MKLPNIFNRTPISTVVPDNNDLIDETLGLTFGILADILQENIVMQMFVDEIVREGDPDTATRDWVTAEDFAEWVVSRANAIQSERKRAKRILREHP